MWCKRVFAISTKFDKNKNPKTTFTLVCLLLFFETLHKIFVLKTPKNRCVLYALYVFSSDKYKKN
jgi:hypothetical protein